MGGGRAKPLHLATPAGRIDCTKRRRRRQRFLDGTRRSADARPRTESNGSGEQDARQRPAAWR
eukprot:11630685-Alexandrium_andersonii.AAC.1